MKEAATINISWFCDRDRLFARSVTLPDYQISAYDIARLTNVKWGLCPFRTDSCVECNITEKYRMKYPLELKFHF
jgi:hypothetical protein